MNKVDPRIVAGLTPTQNSILDQVALQKYYVNVKEFGAKGDGVTDDTKAIQDAIDKSSSDFNTLFIPGGVYLVSTLSIPSFSHIVGAGMGKTTLKAINDSVTVFSVVRSARGVRLRNFDISAPTENYGFANSAISFDEVNGGYEHVLESINIYRFRYGIKFKELFWNNSLKDIRINRCDYSIYCNGTGGQSIQNKAENVYSNEAKTIGWYLGAVINFSLVSCNFGGRKGANDEPSMYLQTVSNSKINLLSCNFESIKCPLNGGTVSIGSSSVVSMKNVTFVTNEGSGLTATHEIILRDNAILTIENVEQKNGSNIGQINIINNAKLLRIDESFPNVYHGSGSTSAALSLSIPYLKTARSSKITLSGSAYEEVLMMLPSNGRLIAYRIVYTQATSADSGISIRLNDAIVGDLFNTVTETSKTKLSKHSTTTVLKTLIRADTPILLICAGGKVGSGEIQVFVDYVLD